MISETHMPHADHEQERLPAGSAFPCPVDVRRCKRPAMQETVGGGYRPLPGSLTSRGFMGSGFQVAMVRVHSRACTVYR
jgi:hypothetical protein